jgi:hypothetical protein
LSVIQPSETPHSYAVLARLVSPVGPGLQRPRTATLYRHAEGYLPTGGVGDGDQDHDGRRDGGSAGGRKRPPMNGVVLVCGCGRRIRASATVAELGPIPCGGEFR